MKRKITCLLFVVVAQFTLLKTHSTAQNKSFNIRWDQSTLNQVTPINEPYANYGRIIQTKTAT
ncbi:hypothetical protein EZ449_13210 [Pedobacter frigidisoli]|uniref:Uncharacterized protein n=1 Tax=Pedobacter frigidisoli TaxID=2530455 RepID=A0A4R0P3L4_9SPHI|nr:hypothetical protein [Pedobacter frigidisoli]TCD08354.1 hypothetical protein EZ449_13210 [Pedobacter frigidisoli]